MITFLATFGLGLGLAVVVVPPWIWVAGIIQRRWSV